MSMYLSIDFLEEYKRLDRLCKDSLSSVEGVSEYIRQMEGMWYDGLRLVKGWERDYKQLKHVRWVRTQLAHEVGTLNSGICTEDDYDWVVEFYNRIISGEDPFALLRRAREGTIKIRPQTVEIYKPTVKIEENQPSTVWARFLSRIKSIFR